MFEQELILVLLFVFSNQSYNESYFFFGFSSSLFFRVLYYLVVGFERERLFKFRISIKFMDSIPYHIELLYWIVF